MIPLFLPPTLEHVRMGAHFELFWNRNILGLVWGLNPGHLRGMWMLYPLPHAPQAPLAKHGLAKNQLKIFNLATKKKFRHSKYFLWSQMTKFRIKMFFRIQLFNLHKIFEVYDDVGRSWQKIQGHVNLRLENPSLCLLCDNDEPQTTLTASMISSPSSLRQRQYMSLFLTFHIL